MPTLNIDGRKVSVDDSFLKLTPEQQNATVDEIASSFKTRTEVADNGRPRVIMMVSSERTSASTKGL